MKKKKMEMEMKDDEGMLGMLGMKKEEMIRMEKNDDEKKILMMKRWRILVILERWE